MAILQSYYDEQVKNISAASSKDLLDAGEYPIPKNVDTIELAAMMQVISTIYNLEEAITK